MCRRQYLQKQRFFQGKHLKNFFIYRFSQKFLRQPKSLTMPSPSPEPGSTNPIHTQRALTTVEAFLQASSYPEYTKTTWLYQKKCLQELTRTPNTTPPRAHDKILKRLTAIEKKLSTPTAMLHKPSTYAYHARLAPSQSLYEKPVPGRALKM